MAVTHSRLVGTTVQPMASCLCDAFYDDVARASVAVFKALVIVALFLDNQTCCSQSASNAGHWQASREVAPHTARVFAGTHPVIVPSGSCAAMLFHSNLLQFEDGLEDAIDSLAGCGWEFFDSLHCELCIGQWPARSDEPTTLASDRSGSACGTLSGEAAIALQSIENETIKPVSEEDPCSGFGGTLAVTCPHISELVGLLKLDYILAVTPDVLVSGVTSRLMYLARLAQVQGRPNAHFHVIQVLHNTPVGTPLSPFAPTASKARAVHTSAPIFCLTHV